MCIRDSSSSETALARNKSHSRECEAKIKLNYSLRQESKCDNAGDRCSPVDIQKPADNRIDKIAGNGGAPDKEITAPPPGCEYRN